MSREIKFRAWIRFLQSMASVIEINLQSGSVLTDGYKYGIESDAVDLMQYTGLKDRNGVEIYEGDILCADGEKYKGAVIYYDGNAQFRVDVFLNGKVVCRYSVPEFISKRSMAMKAECLVIGNIHQNPDLLEK